MAKKEFDIAGYKELMVKYLGDPDGSAMRCPIQGRQEGGYPAGQRGNTFTSMGIWSQSTPSGDVHMVGPQSAAGSQASRNASGVVIVRGGGGSR